MDEKDYRIAVASSDGIVVNNHFGRARAFYIYELKGSVPEAVDIRNLPRSAKWETMMKADFRIIWKNFPIVLTFW